MEPMLIVTMCACFVAVGAALFTVMQGSKKCKEDKPDDDTTSTD